ncbi:MAG: STT3 domain-containing protein [Candidatus ainarchaeum sp.]|nr:STT3 domain-containing protein [Candidatus ainarchaeum sp.]
MGYADFILAAIPIFFYTLVPGLAVAMPLLRNSRLLLYEKIVFGFILGLVIPPFLVFLASLAGIGYSLPVALAASAVIAVAGGAWGAKTGAFKEFSGLEIDTGKPEDRKKLLVWGALTLVMLWAFWARMQSLTPIFYEFDPYYYMYGTQFILTEGSIPPHDVTAWYPQGASHRLAPLTNYLTAGWYSLYTQGGAYDNYLLSMVANVYPPLVGALLCFLLFVLVREEYGAVYGLMAAVFAAVLPRFVEKFCAGSAEIQPWGIFALFFFAAAYALTVYRKDRGLAALSGVAAASVISGSQYFIILSLVYGGYLGIQSLLEFVRGRSLRQFLELNGIIVAAIVLCSATMYLYIPGYPFFVRVAVVAGAYMFAAALYCINKPFNELAFVERAFLFLFSVPTFFVCMLVKDEGEKRSYAVLSLIALGMVVLLMTPIGTMVRSYVATAAGFAGYSEALYMTVAEESPTGGDFSSAFDALGYTVLPGLTLIQLTLIAAGFGLAYAVYRDSKLALLLALLIYPISYVGMSKSKYLLQLGFMLVLAVAVVFGEAEKLARAYLKGDENRKNAREIVRYAAVMFAVVVVLEPHLGGGEPFQGTAVQLTLVQMDPTLALAGGGIDCNKLAQTGYGEAYYLYCAQIPDYWIQPMNWIRANVENDTRVVSWWDYGHWINFFGQKNALTRNEHVNTTIDLMVADKFVFGPKDSAQSGEADLAQFMRDYDAGYVLMDYDLVAKWGALNFLACVYNNETNMSFAASQGGPGASQCEADHRPETVYIPVDRSLSDYCSTPDPTIQLVRGISSFGASYCVYEEAQNGYNAPVVMFYENNLSRQNKAILTSAQLVQNSQGKRYAAYTALYFREPRLWQDNVSGWDDRKGEYYDSNFYKGFYLGELAGFEKVYEYASPSGGMPYIRIYKLLGG